ncbi:MAG TPA: hypothetical protein VIM44_05530 [Rariglobus sp.]
MTIPGGAGFLSWLRRALAMSAVILLAASVVKAAPGPFPYARIGVANGCFVESVAFGDELRARFGGDVWYRLLQWGAQEADEVVAGHAVVVFAHRDRLWCYDVNYGFTPLDLPLAQRDDLPAVAKLATTPYLPRLKPYFPVYREDYPQSPDPAPPAPFDEVEDHDLRDAALVAGRLAAHRKVQLVEFTYPQEGETRHSAAVAFVFNGRVCVYSPSAGTVPFRVTAVTVENLRQLQELLRRIYPGAGNLKVRGAAQ